MPTTLATTAYLDENRLADYKRELDLIPRKEASEKVIPLSRINLEEVQETSLFNALAVQPFETETNGHLEGWYKDRIFGKLGEVLRALTHEETTALLLHHVEELTYEEVAVEMNISADEVRKIIRRGCTKVRRKVSPPNGHHTC